ncbi:hypothetical protein pipiens_018935, partial [Culex pipiens pipiens]
DPLLFKDSTLSKLEQKKSQRYRPPLSNHQHQKEESVQDPEYLSLSPPLEAHWYNSQENIRNTSLISKLPRNESNERNAIWITPSKCLWH